MIGIVVVSHSRALGEAALALAAEMVPEEARPRVAVAAGLDETAFGTDAAAISEAITDVDSPDGVLVLMDLGSALMSTEMALEFVEPDVAGRVRLSAAPLVEGLVAALVTASTGATLDEVTQEADGSLRAKAEHLGVDADAGGSPGADDPDMKDASALTFSHTVRNPHGLHARPAAALVSGLRGLDAVVELRNGSTGGGPANARSIGKVAGLGLRCGDVMEVFVSGPDAEAALARLRDLAAADFGESISLATEPEEATAAGSRGTGRQVVIGPAHVVAASVDTSGYEAEDPSAEQRRLDTALAEVAGELAVLASQDHGDIFEAQAALLADPELVDAMTQDISSGRSAVDAVTSRTASLAEVFAGLSDPYLRDRAEDVRSLQRLLLGSLTGTTAGSATEGSSHVLVVRELDAATAARLGDDTLAVVTTHGGATGHGVIVASSRGIPVLTGRPDLAGVVPGTPLAVDAAGLRVWVAPSQAELAAIRTLAADRDREAAEAADNAHAEAVTTSGVRVLVEANIASLADAATGAAAGADGSGLVRTEILFGHLGVAPAAEDQAARLVEIGKALKGPITIRTWDTGGDKPLPFLAQAAEANPMLGERGIRAMRGREELFRTQLRAVALASREVECRVMVPMVTEPDEVIWARGVFEEVIAELGNTAVPFGMMVEVPAAAVRAADFIDLVDFVSIGTNDLTQYTTASDRGNATVSSLARSDSAAVLDLIAIVGQAFQGKAVAVCGDLASDPHMTAALIERGVTELSVRPPMIGLIKQAVRQY